MGTDEHDTATKVEKEEDVEEGEISDTASVEEISEEDFVNKQEVVVVKETKPKDSRVWTVRDLYKYQMGGGYVNGLYNLAWAQAVQNKPFGELFVEIEPDDNNNNNNNKNNNNLKRSSSSPSSSVNGNGKEVDKVVIVDSGDEMDVNDDNEKEEGELEEGEIDLDSEPPVEKGAGEVKEGISSSDDMNVDGWEVESNEKMELEMKVKLIREALGTASVIEAEKSFEALCSRLQNTMESLWGVVRKLNVPTRDDLVQLSFTAVWAVNSVFSSMNHKLKEQNKDIFSRFLSVLKRHDPPLFSSEQMREIGAMVSSLAFSDVSLSARFGEKEGKKQAPAGLNEKDNNALTNNIGRHDSTAVNKLFSAAESFVENKPNMSLEATKPGLSNFKSRGVLLPLLDLHKDHDADSLPSPTREAAPSLPVCGVSNVDGMMKLGLHAPKAELDAEDSRMHPYETDALKAVSSYQQKFGRSSFFMNDRLPSPTPSEEFGDGDGDTGGEVSSSSAVTNLKTANPPILGQPIVSPSPCPGNSNMQEVIPGGNAPPVSSGSSTTIKPSGKSRDPRLRHANSDANTLDCNQHILPLVNNAPKVDSVGGIMSTRKQKTVDDPIPDGPVLKRQRHAFESSEVVRDAKTVTGSGGWLDDIDGVGPQSMNGNQLAENAESDPRRTGSGVTCPNTGSGKSNVSTSRNEQIPITGTSSISGSEQVPVTVTNTTSLPDLLKDIAVNPTMLINILKMGQQQGLALERQQKPVDPAKSSTHPPSSNSILGAVPAVNVALPQSSGILPRPSGTLPVPSQVATTDEVGKIRMKPRDPRRVLHNNALPRTGSLGSEQLKTNVTSSSTVQMTKDDQDMQKQEGQTGMKPVLSQSFVPPDISLPFTKSLKNIADIVSVSQPSTTPPLVSENLASQPMQNNSERVDSKPVVSNPDQQTGTGSVPEVGADGPRPQSAWGDVEHLFEAYDDYQKAAIQRERARRIEEQKKMFVARKLCLVLDLDHTLLNSAKFSEVDPVHDEILRKKEEQDREKPQRHLFRFPHMGMWTKLRPGIWNFLEKASKLYELHLYTMGNKLYATEMAKVLDPKGVLFAGRVISRGDDADPFDGDERVPRSKDLEGVLGMESAVVIIDDSVRVWPHNKLNLIVVERYIYFPCSRRQFCLSGPSLLEIDHDERPEDGTLACSLAVIERIHQNFFTHQSLDEADVRNILAVEQRKILAGCRILFSRVFPVGEANPHLHPLWQTAEQFGAVCTNQIDEQVTHVVANSPGTDKVNWALSTGRHVVHTGWVEASALLYRRANEQDFAIKP